MNSLHKTLFLLLICMSISSPCLSTLDNDIQEKMDAMKVQHITGEILDDAECNCERLKELNDFQLDIAENLLFPIYLASMAADVFLEKSEKLTKLFPRIKEKNMTTEHANELGELSKKGKCIEKIMTIINELRKSE